MLPEYQLLHTKLHNNRLFLYNYAAELNFSGHYEESQSVARECERFWADYDLQMLQANNYEQLKDYPNAEQCYRKAAVMCPVKFMPLYSLAKMYDETGRSSEAVALAEKIVRKTVKIPSPNIIAIQQKMRQLIQREAENDSVYQPITENLPSNHRQGHTPNVQPSDAALPP